MARMLEALDVAAGMRVLDFGTGTGYNAALLSTRLGSDRVTTVDVDPALTGPAERRLNAIGLTPTVVTGEAPTATRRGHHSTGSSQRARSGRSHPRGWSSSPRAAGSW